MKINLGEDFNIDKLIKKNADAGQMLLVLDGEGIQGPIINI
jgi:hypothetical protein